MAATTTLRRDELFELIWSRPVRDVARDLGISDVALAKICRKLNVPRPPRGYWQQVASGQKPRRARLTPARPGTRTEYTLDYHPPRPERPLKEAQEPPPEVHIADNLRRAHAVARALDAALEKRKPDENGMLYLPAAHESCVRVSSAFRRRTILILDALARALEARGHTVTFESPERDAWGPHAISAMVRGQAIAIRFFEPLLRKDAVLTPAQEAQQKKYGWSLGSKYVYTPTGKLTLRADGGYLCRQKWSDGKGRTVEQQLGAAVLGFERVAVRVQEKNAEWARQQDEWRAAARRKEIEEAEGNYRRALDVDLKETVERWRYARDVRAFLHDVEARVPPGHRTAAQVAWIAWVKEEVERIDPISNPLRMVSDLEPDFANMPDDELRTWSHWNAETGPRPFCDPALGDEHDEDDSEDEDSNLEFA